MQYYYSASTNSFYVDVVHFDADVPDDLQPVDERTYNEIVLAGAGWTPGSDGMPVANPVPDMPDPPPDPDLPAFTASRTVRFRDRFASSLSAPPLASLGTPQNDAQAPQAVADDTEQQPAEKTL